MDDDKHPKQGAHAKEDEPLLGVGVIGVWNEKDSLVHEDRERLLERDAVLGRFALAVRGPRRSEAEARLTAYPIVRTMYIR